MLSVYIPENVLEIVWLPRGSSLLDIETFDEAWRFISDEFGIAVRRLDSLGISDTVISKSLLLIDPSTVWLLVGIKSGVSELESSFILDGMGGIKSGVPELESSFILDGMGGIKSGVPELESSFILD